MAKQKNAKKKTKIDENAYNAIKKEANEANENFEEYAEYLFCKS